MTAEFLPTVKFSYQFCLLRRVNKCYHPMNRKGWSKGGRLWFNIQPKVLSKLFFPIPPAWCKRRKEQQS